MNEAIPPHAPQNPQVPVEERSMSNMEIIMTIHCLTGVLDTQLSWDARVRLNPNANSIASRIRDFSRINPPIFFCSKVDEDP